MDADGALRGRGRPTTAAAAVTMATRRREDSQHKRAPRRLRACACPQRLRRANGRGRSIEHRAAQKRRERGGEGRPDAREGIRTDGLEVAFFWRTGQVARNLRVQVGGAA